MIKKVLKVFFGMMAVMSFIMVIAVVSGAVIPEGAKAVGNDIILFKASMSAIFLSIGIAFAICLGGFDKKRLISSAIVLFVGMIICGICFNMISEGFISSFESSSDLSITDADNTGKEAPSGKAPSDKAVPETENSADGADKTEPTAEKDTAIDPEARAAYEALSDEELAQLTKYIAKSFYSFTLEEEDYNEMMTYPEVAECIKTVYYYAYDNCWELDPAFEAVLSERMDIVSSIPEWELFNERFTVERRYDNKSGEWVYDINSYSIDPEAMFYNDGEYYLDAEGYLGIGCVLYWEEEGKMVRAGTVVDIAKDREIDGTVYAYALNIDYEMDDTLSDGWHNGEALLTFNKRAGGDPIYYVKAMDERRSIARESIDYFSNVVWTRLNEKNARVGTEVYFGASSAKSYSFTIVELDKGNDLMLVRYPSGSIEEKSYSAMINNGSLFVK